MLSLGELKSIKDMLKKWEGSEPFFYQDSVGLVTVGVGNLVSDANAATKLNMVNMNGMLATDEEKKLAYEAVWNAGGNAHDKCSI